MLSESSPEDDFSQSCEPPGASAPSGPSRPPQRPHRPPAQLTSLQLEPLPKRGWITRHDAIPLPQMASPKRTHLSVPLTPTPPPPPHISPEDQNSEEENNNTDAQTTQSSSAAPSRSFTLSSTSQGSQRFQAQPTEEEHYCCGCWEKFWSVVCCMPHRSRGIEPAAS
ncbi:hypothetical protein M405DRAFT_823860 [Rhizopogon salebrosus TDB-379]|nr:hypothetical protein M405DRAFT_823860 [Rhizopogon salebrosus TDB-379]